MSWAEKLALALRPAQPQSTGWAGASGRRSPGGRNVLLKRHFSAGRGDFLGGAKVRAIVDAGADRVRREAPCLRKAALVERGAVSARAYNRPHFGARAAGLFGLRPKAALRSSRHSADSPSRVG